MGDALSKSKSKMDIKVAIRKFVIAFLVVTCNACILLGSPSHLPVLRKRLDLYRRGRPGAAFQHNYCRRSCSISAIPVPQVSSTATQNALPEADYVKIIAFN